MLIQSAGGPPHRRGHRTGRAASVDNGEGKGGIERYSRLSEFHRKESRVVAHVLAEGTAALTALEMMLTSTQEGWLEMLIGGGLMGEGRVIVNGRGGRSTNS